MEEKNSKPLESGMRGLFIQNLKTGWMHGWVLTAAPDSSDWTFKGVSVDPKEFNPEEAPDFSGNADDGSWKCESKRVVFDDV